MKVAFSKGVREREREREESGREEEGERVD